MQKSRMASNNGTPGLGCRNLKWEQWGKGKHEKGPATDTRGSDLLFAKRWSLLRSKKRARKKDFALGVRPVGQRSMGRTMECDGAIGA